MDCVIMSEPCYKKGTILQRNNRKMAFNYHDEWSFSYDFLVKFHFKKFGSQNMTLLYPNEVCYNKEIALYNY